MTDPYAEKWSRLEERILNEPATLTPQRRQAAATTEEGLAQKVRRAAHEVTDNDIERALHDHSQDELFELIVSAALGAARHRLHLGLECLCD